MCSSKSLVNILKSAHNLLCDNLRNESQLKTRSVRIEYFGRQSLMYLGPKMWELPPNLRKLETVTNLGLKNGNQKNVLVGSARLIYSKLILFKSFCFHLILTFQFYHSLFWKNLLVITNTIENQSVDILSTSKGTDSYYDGLFWLKGVCKINCIYILIYVICSYFSELTLNSYL